MSYMVLARMDKIEFCPYALVPTYAWLMACLFGKANLNLKSDKFKNFERKAQLDGNNVL